MMVDFLSMKEQEEIVDINYVKVKLSSALLYKWPTIS